MFASVALFLSRLCSEISVRLVVPVDNRRVPVPTLNLANRPSHIAITGLRNAGQGRGELEQEGVAVARL
jgi:hypothetical protein